MLGYVRMGKELRKGSELIRIMITFQEAEYQKNKDNW